MAKKIPPPETLEEVIERVKALGSLDAQRKNDLCSGVRTICKMLGTSPKIACANPRAIRMQLDELHPIQAGLTEQRYRNALSALNTSLKLAGAVSASGGKPPELNHEWQTLRELCPKDVYRWRLAQFMKFHSDRGISPSAVCTETLDRFERHLDESLLSKDASVIRRMAARAWDECASQVSDWPQQKLHHRRPTPRRTVQLEDLAKSFQDQVTAHETRLTSFDPFTEEPSHRMLRPNTIKYRRFVIAKAVWVLTKLGLDIQDIKTFEDVASPERIKMILKFLHSTPGYGASSLHGMSLTLISIARHELGVQGAELDKLRAISTRLKPKRDGLAERTKARSSAFDNPENIDRLILAPLTLAARARKRSLPPLRSALIMQNAVAIEILLMTAIRIGNLASIEIGRQLRLLGSQSMALVLSGNETKNSKEQSFVLPAQSVELIREYIDDFHPDLPCAVNGFLFPSRTGRHKATTSLGPQISKAIWDTTGCRVHPHLMRHLAGKLYLQTHPNGHEVVRQLLNHSSIDTTIGSYVGEDQQRAAQLLDQNIIARRQEALIGPHHLIGGR